jgi:SAM-dependent MidA family methyltransferase
MANIQQYNLTWAEWLAKSGTAYYIDYGTSYQLYKVDTTLANQILWCTHIFYVAPLTSTQQTDLTAFLAIKAGSTQVDSVDEVVSAAF